MDVQHLPSGSWDCHVHVLDPDRFPYRSDRTYTPVPAKLESLISSSVFDCILIVQASVEDGPEPLLQHLREGQTAFPERTLRGAVMTTTRKRQDVTQYETSYADALHAAGVRCVRIHTGLGSFGTDSGQLQDYLLRLVGSYCVASLGWAVSIQQPLQAWPHLKHCLTNIKRAHNVTFIAEHNGSATPADVDTPALIEFLDLLREDVVSFVKISALHRRSPGNIQAMKPIVEQLVSSRPEGTLWGTDWPHTNAAAKDLSPQQPLKGVDSAAELAAVASWLTEDQLTKMLLHNPRRLFF